MQHQQAYGAFKVFLHHSTQILGLIQQIPHLTLRIDKSLGQCLDERLLLLLALGQIRIFQSLLFSRMQLILILLLNSLVLNITLKKLIVIVTLAIRVALTSQLVYLFELEVFEYFVADGAGVHC